MQLYSPQFAAGGNIWRSTLTLSFISNDGLELGNSTAVDLGGNARLVITDPAIFGLVAVPGDLLEGYVRITSSTARVAGVVSFGDPADTRFRTSLPFVAQGATDLVFSQVAVDGTWFTGLAAVNANSVAAGVTISVFRTDGSLASTGSSRIEPNSRFSKLLTQLVPNLPLLSKGYFTVHSSQPLFSFAVFGTQSLSVLSAIPAQRGEGGSHEGLLHTSCAAPPVLECTAAPGPGLTAGPGHFRLFEAGLEVTASPVFRPNRRRRQA